MKLRFYFDLHFDSPIEMLKSQALQESPSKYLYFGGDIFDLRNVLKKYLAEARANYRAFKNKHFIDGLDHYIDGNHDDENGQDQFCLIISEDTKKRIGMFHGDIQANPDKWWKYRSEPKGASWFKRTFIVPFIEIAEKIVDRKPKRDFIDRVLRIMETFDLDIYICGHFHPPEIIRHVTTYKGKAREIIICPRGCTDLDL